MKWAHRKGRRPFTKYRVRLNFQNHPLPGRPRPDFPTIIFTHYFFQLLFLHILVLHIKRKNKIFDPGRYTSEIKGGGGGGGYLSCNGTYRQNK